MYISTIYYNKSKLIRHWTIVSLLNKDLKAIFEFFCMSTIVISWQEQVEANIFFPM